MNNLEINLSLQEDVHKPYAKTMPLEWHLYRPEHVKVLPSVRCGVLEPVPYGYQRMVLACLCIYMFVWGGKYLYISPHYPVAKAERLDGPWLTDLYLYYNRASHCFLFHVLLLFLDHSCPSSFPTGDACMAYLKTHA